MFMFVFVMFIILISLIEFLEGFLENPPLLAGRLMAFRNVVVAPLRLRRSPLCCPVSSLISQNNKNMFAGSSF
jgi:hypothetical protein